MSISARDIKRRVTGGALWTYGGMFSDRALHFLVFTLVARMVEPAEFGVVMAALLTVQVIEVMLNGGIPTALLQESEVPKPLIDTAFTINLFFSVLATLILFLGAAPLSHAVQMPVTTLLQVLALTPFLNALGAAHVALIQRKLGFKALGLRQAGASLFASAFALVLAFAGAGIWTLVARTVALAVAGTVMAFMATSYRLALRLDFAVARNALISGLRLWGAHLAWMVNAKGLDVLAGMLLGVVALGALRIASQSLMMLVDLTVGPMSALGYALLARAKGNPKLFEQTIVTLARCAALLIFPAFAGLFALGDTLLPLVFREHWSNAAEILPWMCLVAPALYFQFLISSALFAVGRSDRILHWSLIQAVLTVVLSLIAARFGLMGIAAAGTVRVYLMFPLGWRWLREDVGVSAWCLVPPALPALAASLAMVAAVSVAEAKLAPVLAPVALMAASIAIGVIVYGALTAYSAADLWRAMVARRDMGDDPEARPRHRAVGAQVAPVIPQ